MGKAPTPQEKRDTTPAWVRARARARVNARDRANIPQALTPHPRGGYRRGVGAGQARGRRGVGAGAAPDGNSAGKLS